MIEAKAVIADLEKHKEKAMKNYHVAMLVPLQVVDIIVMLLKAQEPKKGHWILDPDGMDWGLPAWRCSECGGRNDCLPAYVGGQPAKNIYRWAGSQYCPNCGAKMEEEVKQNA